MVFDETFFTSYEIIIYFIATSNIFDACFTCYQESTQKQE